MNKLLLLVALSVLPGCGQDQDKSSSQSTFSDTGSENDIRNFHTVHPFLYRSGEVRNAQVADLKRLGVKTILSLQDASEQATAEAKGVAFKLDAMSSSDKPTVAQIKAALKVITNPANQPVLVHCTYGKDRTGIVIAAYRILYDGWTTAQAKAEMRTMGHIPSLYWWDDVLDDL